MKDVMRLSDEIREGELELVRPQAACVQPGRNAVRSPRKSRMFAVVQAVAGPQERRATST